MLLLYQSRLTEMLKEEDKTGPNCLLNQYEVGAHSCLWLKINKQLHNQPALAPTSSVKWKELQCHFVEMLGVTRTK